jgi:hypothetical protein
MDTFPEGEVMLADKAFSADPLPPPPLPPLQLVRIITIVRTTIDRMIIRNFAVPTGNPPHA